MALKWCATSARQISFESKSFPRGDYRQIWCWQILLKLIHAIFFKITWPLNDDLTNVLNQYQTSYGLPAIINSQQLLFEHLKTELNSPVTF